LISGDVGTVVHIHVDAAAYEVEFATLTGKTIAVALCYQRSAGPLPTATSTTCARCRLPDRATVETLAKEVPQLRAHVT
jgi:hypothetical protein